MSVALADLPVLIQMALNISTIVTTLQSGQPISAAEAAAIQNISAQASNDLNLLATLHNQYKTTRVRVLCRRSRCHRGRRPEPAGPLAGSVHRRSGSLGTGGSGSQSDPDYRCQFRGADATNLGATHGTKGGPSASRHS
jgi:hypothetical protein